MEARIIITTFPPERATDVVRTLVEEGLAACGNLVPGVTSVFRWKGAVEVEPETVVFLKTWGDRVDGLRKRLVELHPYEVPEFLVLEVSDGLPAYVDWILGETR